MSNAALNKAIKIFGNQSRLAVALGCSQHAVWSAVKRGRVSAQMAVAIERATRGAVKRAQLRPDLFSGLHDA